MYSTYYKIREAFSRNSFKAIAAALWLTFTAQSATAQTSAFDDVTARMAAASMQGYTEVYDAEAFSLKAESVPSDPEVEFEYLFPQSSGELNRWSIGVSQELPNIWKVRANRQTVSALFDLQKLRYEEAVASESYEAEQLVIQIIAARKQLKLLREIAGNIKELSEKYQMAYDKGEVSILDVNKLKIEYARVLSACDAVEGELYALIAEAVATSGDEIKAADFDAISEYPVRQLLPYANYLTALTNSAACRADSIDLNVSRLREKIASKERIPSLSLGYVHAYEDGNHFNGFSAGLTLPVYSRKSGVQAAAYSTLAKYNENDTKQRDRISALGVDYHKAIALKHQLDLLGPVIETTDNQRLLKLALDGGEISLLDYIQETNYFLVAHQDYLTASRDYALALSSLNRYSH